MRELCMTVTGGSGRGLQEDRKRLQIGDNVTPADAEVADFIDYGEVAERLNAPVLKTGGPSQVS